LAERIRGKAIYVYEAKSWYIFTGKRWESDTTGAIYRMAAETAREIYHEAADEPNEEKRNDIVKWAKLSESRVRREAMVKDAANQPGVTVCATIFDTDPHVLACNNGTIDLRTGELRPSRPEDYVSKLAPVDWRGLDSFAPRWSKFLEEIIPDREIRDYLRVAAGYGATGLSNARAFFICHGSGRNGKGTFLETVRDVLGDYGHTAKPETFLESRREGGAASTDVASIKGARLVVTSETKRGAKIDTNLVKSLTGDDKINARHLFERPMEFKPSWSVFVATNHKPEMPGDDEALWERVKLVPFDEIAWDAFHKEYFIQQLSGQVAYGDDDERPFPSEGDDAAMARWLKDEMLSTMGAGVAVCHFKGGGEPAEELSYTDQRWIYGDTLLDYCCYAGAFADRPFDMPDEPTEAQEEQWWEWTYERMDTVEATLWDEVEQMLLTNWHLVEGLAAALGANPFLDGTYVHELFERIEARRAAAA
jgi:P4 family phage/plasmid primase-like protien